MRLKNGKWNIVWRRLAALTLACGLILPLVPGAEAKALNVEKGKVTLYHYDWINSYEELMSEEIFPQDQWVDVMLAWDNTSGKESWGDGKVWYAGAALDPEGNPTYKGDGPIDVDNVEWDYFSYTANEDWYIGGDSGVSADAEGFFLTEPMGHMLLKRVGEDDNKNNYSWDGYDRKISPVFHMGMKDRYGRDHFFGQEKAYGRNGSVMVHDRLIDCEYKGSSEEYDLTVQLFADTSKKDNSNYRYGAVNIFANIEGLFGADDHYVKHKSNGLFMKGESDNGNAWDRTVRIYVKTVEEFDVFVDDIEVVDGWTFRIDEDVMLPEDATITVKDGGVMAVNSHLVLNGKVIVEEGGTVIINEGGAVNPYFTDYEEAGSFDIRGGNVIVMDGAKLAANDVESYIYISKGGSLVNRGLVIANAVNLSDSSRFLIEEGAYFMMGYSTTESRASMKTDTIQEIVDRADGMMGTHLVLGRLDISGRSQLINRGETRIYYEDLGMTSRAIIASRTANTVCGNEGKGTLNGKFVFSETAENGYAVKYLPWPNGWPDAT